MFIASCHLSHFGFFQNIFSHETLNKGADVVINIHKRFIDRCKCLKKSLIYSELFSIYLYELLIYINKLNNVKSKKQLKDFT